MTKYMPVIPSSRTLLSKVNVTSWKRFSSDLGWFTATILRSRSRSIIQTLDEVNQTSPRTREATTSRAQSGHGILPYLHIELNHEVPVLRRRLDKGQGHQTQSRRHDSQACVYGLWQAFLNRRADQRRVPTGPKA